MRIREQSQPRAGVALSMACTVLWIAFTCYPAAAQPPEKIPQLPLANTIETVSIPDVAPHGVALVDRRLWIADPTQRALHEVDVEAKSVLRSVPVAAQDAALRGLAWDGKHFWSADSKRAVVYQIDPTNGEVRRSLRVPIYGPEDAATVEAVAWDGRYLWVAYSAGWSSRIHRMDTQTGQVVLSMFAGCMPRALASDGRNLWIVDYNQGVAPGVVIQTEISDSPDRMLANRRYVVKTSGDEPGGATCDDGALWVADRETGSVQKLEIPPAP